MLIADELSWGGTYVTVWDGFGTSPYTAIDATDNNRTLQIFCLDFNDSIAPPMTWNASLIPLSPANVAGTGAYQNVYAAQYGGAYNALIQNAYKSTPVNQRAPGETLSQVEVSGPPFVFTGDNSSPPTETGTNSALQGAGADAVNMSSSTNDPYTRYVEAAWLFSNILDAVGHNPEDINTDMIAQVAAWELFVNAKNLDYVVNAVDTTGKSSEVGNSGAYRSVNTYSFTNYLASSGTVSGISFEEAVDLALEDAQNAVNGGWSPAGWSIVTATPDYVIGYGQPVQEFLTFGDAPTPPPQAQTPEPAAIFLLATISGILLWSFRVRLTV